MNVVNLIGRMVATPELKSTQTGVSVTSFTLAVDRAYTPKGEEKQTDFIKCVAWRGTAEFITRYFAKGNRFAVNGSLQQRNYTAKDGSNRTEYEVIVDNAYFCETRQAPSVTQYEQEEEVAQDEQYEVITTDDDLPF